MQKDSFMFIPLPGDPGYEEYAEESLPTTLTAARKASECVKWGDDEEALPTITDQLVNDFKTAKITSKPQALKPTFVLKCDNNFSVLAQLADDEVPAETSVHRRTCAQGSQSQDQSLTASQQLSPTPLESWSRPTRRVRRA
jgi:hypothetical protein